MPPVTNPWGAGPTDDELRKAGLGLYAEQAQARQSRSTGATPSTSGGQGSVVGQATGNAGVPASPGSYNTGAIYNSPQWYGNLGAYGATQAASDPGAFWGYYGSDVMGMDPGGAGTAFLADKYNTLNLGAAMFGGNQYQTEDEKLAGQTALANRFSGDRVAFMDPGPMIGNVLRALSSNDPAAAGDKAPIIQNLINSMAQSPSDAPTLLANFLGSILSASMSPEDVSAMMTTITRLGARFAVDLGHGSPKKLDTANFARYLMSVLGPTLGL